MWESPTGWLPYVFFYNANEGWAIRASGAIRCVSCYYEAIKDVCDKNVSCRFVYIVLLPLKGNTDQFFQLN